MLAPGTDEAAWRQNHKEGIQAFRNGELEMARLRKANPEHPEVGVITGGIDAADDQARE